MVSEAALSDSLASVSAPLSSPPFLFRRWLGAARFIEFPPVRMIEVLRDPINARCVTALTFEIKKE